MVPLLGDWTVQTLESAQGIEQQSTKSGALRMRPYRADGRHRTSLFPCFSRKYCRPSCFAVRNRNSSHITYGGRHPA